MPVFISHAVTSVVVDIQIGLVPGLKVGMGDGGVGCFQATGGLTRVSMSGSYWASCPTTVCMLYKAWVRCNRTADQAP